MLDDKRSERVLCSCFPAEDPWTHYGIVEPGGAFEPNPGCPAHFPEDAPSTGTQTESETGR